MSIDEVASVAYRPDPRHDAALRARRFEPETDYHVSPWMEQLGAEGWTLAFYQRRSSGAIPALSLRLDTRDDETIVHIVSRPEQARYDCRITVPSADVPLAIDGYLAGLRSKQ